MKLIRIEQWLFYLLIFFLPLQLRIILHSFRLQFNEWTSIYLYANDILLISIIFLWLVREFKDKKFTRLRQYFGKPEIILSIFLLIGAFSLLVSDNLKLSAYSLLKLIEFSVLFLYLRYNFSRFYNLERFWQVFVASASIQSLVAITQFLKQKSLGLKFLAESPLSPEIAGVAKIVVQDERIIRAYGLVPHPNILATFLILAIFGLIFLFIKNHEQLNVVKKIAFVLVFALLSLALFLTFSRAVCVVGLAFLIGWLVYLYWSGQQKRAALVSLIALFLAGFLLSAIFWPYLLSRYDVAGLGKTQAVSLRIFYNKIAFDLIKGSPIFGIGQGTFVWAISNLGLFESWVYQPVHNIYVLIAAETGTLGLLAFLGFLFVTIWGVFKKRASLGEEDKFAAFHWLFVISFLLLVGLSDHFFWTLQQGQLMLWIGLGILALVVHTESRYSSG